MTIPLGGICKLLPFTHMKTKKSVKQGAVHRIRIIQGHLNAIKKMLESDRYCVDIIHQSMAVQKALKSLDMLLMKNHLQTCVVAQIKGDEIEKSVTELATLFEMK